MLYDIKKHQEQQGNCKHVKHEQKDCSSMKSGASVNSMQS